MNLVKFADMRRIKLSKDEKMALRMLADGVDVAKMPDDCRLAVFDLVGKDLAEFQRNNSNDAFDALVDGFKSWYKTRHIAPRRAIDWRWVVLTITWVCTAINIAILFLRIQN